MSRVAQAEEGYAGSDPHSVHSARAALPIGGGDISFYRDIATMDPYPGTLNGILSLLFNSTDPAVAVFGAGTSGGPLFPSRDGGGVVVADSSSDIPQSQHLPEFRSCC